jgi:membrane protein implicated in regulation of membrane protease activity
MLWWHWFVVGLVLALAELATPGGFYILFFGLGALVVGALAAAELAGPVWAQLLLFAAVSVVLLIVFRARLLRLTQVDPQAPPIDTLVGEIGTVFEPMSPDSVGKVQLRGTAWSARNASAAILAAGSRVKVVSVDGLTLHVAPEGGRS